MDLTTSPRRTRALLAAGVIMGLLAIIFIPEQADSSHGRRGSRTCWRVTETVAPAPATATDSNPTDSTPTDSTPTDSTPTESAPATAPIAAPIAAATVAEVGWVEQTAAAIQAWLDNWWQTWLASWLPGAIAPAAPAAAAPAPAAAAPVADTPVADTPVADTPVVDTPIADTPVADTPAVDAPALDDTATDGAQTDEGWTSENPWDGSGWRCSSRRWDENATDGQGPDAPPVSQEVPDEISSPDTSVAPTTPAPTSPTPTSPTPTSPPATAPAVTTPPAAAAPPPAPSTSSGRVYPWHTGIVATTFWVGELFNANLSDGSQVCSTYDANWAYSWSGVAKGAVSFNADGCAGSVLGGCDGIAGSDGTCRTEPRTAANNFFPTQITPRENPFYLDLPFDDLNDKTGFSTRCQVVPWANDPGYAGRCNDQNFSYMKNRWVRIVGPNGSTCYGQVQDAGPSHDNLYHDANYVFGASDAPPVQGQFNNAGMDVSPALNGCLGFSSLDGQSDQVSWQFVDDADVPAGPWRLVVTTSQVRN